MSRTHRWLTTAAIIASVMPLLMMAFIIKLLPVDIPIVNFSLVDAEPEYVSRYNNLMAGLFCIVPLSIVLIARFISGRDAAANITAMLVVSIMLGSVFTAVVLFGGLRQISYIQVTAKFDYIGFLCVALSLGIAVAGNVLMFKEPGSKFAINNKYTRSDPVIWKKVHMSISAFQPVFFVLASIPMSLMDGAGSLFFLLGICLMFFIWTYVWSFIVKDRLMNSQIRSLSEDEESDEDL